MRIAPHDRFRLQHRNLVTTLRVAPWEAALGATVKAPTPAGPVDLKIPPNSQGGKKLRLKGRGIPAREPGDFYVELRIALPPADDAGAREAYEAMQREFAFNPRAGMEV